MGVSRDDFLATTQAKSDQINSVDLLGGPLTCQITDIQMTGSADQPICIYVDAHPQPWKPSKTSRRVLAACWADSEPSEWVGRTIVLYNDPTVKWAGKAEGGIRCSHLSHIDGEKTIMVNETRGKKAAQKVLPYQASDTPKAAPTYWPDDAFEKQVVRATDSIINDGKSADGIIAALEKKALLTAGQKARLQAIKAPDPIPDDEPPLEDSEDPFAE